MRLALLFQIVSIVAIATATTEIRESDETDFFKPNSYPYYEPRGVDPRQEMMTLSLIFPVRQTRPTIMQMATSTSTVVCTKYVATACGFRTSTLEKPDRPSRRPAWFIRRSPLLQPFPPVNEDERETDLVMEDDMDRQFALYPTTVQRVESTRLPRLPSRQDRAADPRLMFVYGNGPQDIESGFRSDPYKPVSVPLSRKYNQPAAAQNRQFLQNYWTVTRRTTVMEITLSTSTPVCSKPGSIPQCAIEEVDRKCSK